MNVLKKEVQEKRSTEIKKKPVTKKKTTSKKKTVNKDDKPYLSVVVPCYNCSDTIERLLNSIVNQEGYDNTFETIIQDDGHDDGYLDIVEKYKKKYPELCIKVYHNKPREVHCPSNTRLDGMSNAIGEWITFIDHDDMFEPNAFASFYKCVKETKVETVIVTRFRNFNIEYGTYGEEYDRNNVTWLHGKFYNMKFLKDHNITFQENLRSHEDLYFNQTIFATVSLQNLQYFMVNEFTYKWINNGDSTSRKLYEDNMYYIDKYFDEYLFTSIQPWLKALEEKPSLEQDVFKRCCYTLLFGYFYYQSFYYRRGFHHHRKNRDAYEDVLLMVMKRFGASVDDIARIIYSNPEMYNKVRESSFRGAKIVIESESFYDFISRFG